MNQFMYVHKVLFLDMYFNSEIEMKSSYKFFVKYYLLYNCSSICTMYIQQQ